MIVEITPAAMRRGLEVWQFMAITEPPAPPNSIRQRQYRVESGLFERARSAWGEGATEQTSDIDVVLLRLSTSNGDELAKLSRYEAAIERWLRRALLDLERRQRKRLPSPLAQDARIP
jgi:hypothetical protein